MKKIVIIGKSMQVTFSPIDDLAKLYFNEVFLKVFMTHGFQEYFVKVLTEYTNGKVDEGILMGLIEFGPQSLTFESDGSKFELDRIHSISTTFDSEVSSGRFLIHFLAKDVEKFNKKPKEFFLEYSFVVHYVDAKGDKQNLLDFNTFVEIHKFNPPRSI